jgi:hypothetical protein
MFTVDQNKSALFICYCTYFKTASHPWIEDKNMNYASLVTTFFGSLLASYLVIGVLYTVTNHIVLWLIFFVLLSLYLIWFSMVYDYLYKELHEKDLWYQARHNFILFIQMTFVLTSLRIVFDIVVYGISVTPMYLTDYINLFNLSVFFVFFLLFKLQTMIDRKY